MIFNRLAIIFRRAGNAKMRKAAAIRATRWKVAADRDPKLVEDIVHMGRFLTLPPMDGADLVDASEAQIMFEKGRNSLAVEILAMMQITQSEFIQLQEKEDVYR